MNLQVNLEYNEMVKFTIKNIHRNVSLLANQMFYANQNKKTIYDSLFLMLI